VAAAAKSYDLVLRTPFESISVLAWRPKLRNPDGSAVLEKRGTSVVGARAWFTFDNRRLYTLQRVAAECWPARCAVVVRCLEDTTSEKSSQIRKFQTCTEGKSVEIGRRHDVRSFWSWADAVLAAHGGPPPEDQLKAEGSFSEDLQSADLWARGPVPISQDSDQDSDDDEEQEHVIRKVPAGGEDTHRADVKAEPYIRKPPHTVQVDERNVGHGKSNADSWADCSGSWLDQQSDGGVNWRPAGSSKTPKASAGTTAINNGGDDDANSGDKSSRGKTSRGRGSRVSNGSRGRGAASGNSGGRWKPVSTD